MNNGLSGIKNIIWALAIVIALLALLVGLIFSVAARNYGDAPDGTLVLSTGSQAVDSRGSRLDADPYSPIVGGGTLKELPSTQDGGLEYVFGMTYLCTSSFSGINDYTSTVGGGANAIMWADSGSGIPASAAADTEVLLSDGSLVTPSKAAAIYQPKRLVIYIGTDGLGTASQESFTAGYKKLISSVQAASSGTTIICCSLASVSSSIPRSRRRNGGEDRRGEQLDKADLHGHRRILCRPCFPAQRQRRVYFRRVRHARRQDHQLRRYRQDSRIFPLSLRIR